MLSRRKLLSMVLIMFVLLALYMFTQVYVSSAADYDVNPYAAAVTLRRSDSWEAEAGGGTARRMVLIGGAESGIGGIVTQWCTYAKRPLNCYSSLSEYLAADNGGAQVLCIDPRCLSLPEDEARLAELAGRDLTVIFCALPDADTVIRSPALRALLGVEDIERKQTPLTGVYLYEGFLLGGEALYGRDTGMDVDMEIPWYRLESGIKVYITGLAHRAEADEGQDRRPAILWRNNEGRARVFAVNGDLMEDETGLGLLAGMIAESSSYLLYPVVNAQNLTVADYPSFATENSAELQRIYASSHRLLLQNTVWQGLLAVSERSGFKMTCFLTMHLRGAEEAPRTADLEYYMRQLGERGGEAGRSADGSGSDSPVSQWERDSAFLREAGSRYTHTAVYVGEDAAGFLSIAASGEVPDIRTVTSDSDRPLLSFLTEDITCQGLTHHANQYGFREDLKNRSIQTAIAYTNILLDLRRVTWPETEADHWENYSREVLGNIETWWKPYSQFNKTTATECDSSLRRFLALGCEDRREGDTITLELSGREGTVSFLLRTHDQEVQSMSGGTAARLEKNIWLLSIEENTARIELRSGLS